LSDTTGKNWVFVFECGTALAGGIVEVGKVEALMSAVQKGLLLCMVCNVQNADFQYVSFFVVTLLVPLLFFSFVLVCFDTTYAHVFS
jgi:hypothetical protein